MRIQEVKKILKIQNSRIFRASKKVGEYTKNLTNLGNTENQINIESQENQENVENLQNQEN